MAAIVEWVKNYSMVFLLMTMMTSVIAKQEYKKYIQLFVEIVLVITMANPLLRLMGKSEGLFEKISYDSFWQGLAGIQKDCGKMDFLGEDYYIEYYEGAIEADIKLLAENSGYAVTDVIVTLNEEYGVDAMELRVARQAVETVIIGTLDDQGENEEITALKEKIAAYYQIPRERILIHYG